MRQLFSHTIVSVKNTALPGNGSASGGQAWGGGPGPPRPCTAACEGEWSLEGVSNWLKRCRGDSSTHQRKPMTHKISSQQYPRT